MTANPKWLVLYTRARNEKKVAGLLEARGYTVYCPLRRTKKQWSDRLKWVDEPLFTSYIFIRIEDHRRDEVFFTPGVVRYLFWLGNPAVVRDDEIEALKRFMNEHIKSEAQVEVQPLSPEDRVRIKSGPLMDLEAEVEQVLGNKVVLYLPSLEAKVQMDLRETIVEVEAKVKATIEG